jgi:phosphatidylglycerophosphate synthase
MAPVARWLNDHGVEANQVTLTGLGLTVLGSVGAFLANTGRSEIPQIIPALTSVAGGGADMLDGPVARETPNRTDAQKITGKNLDAASDRIGAIASAFLRAETARLRGDEIGKHLAVINAVVQNLPGLARALAETKGVSSRELAVGSYPPRWILGLIGTHLPVSGDTAVQPWTDGISAVASVYTAGRRLTDLATRRGEPVSPTTQIEAKSKFKWLLGITGTAVTAAAAYELATAKHP